MKMSAALTMAQNCIREAVQCVVDVENRVLEAGHSRHPPREAQQRDQLRECVRCDDCVAPACDTGEVMPRCSVKSNA